MIIKLINLGSRIFRTMIIREDDKFIWKMQTILDPHPFLFPHRAQNHEARWPRSERLYTRRGGIIRGSEERRRRRGASTAVDWSVTGGHRMRGLSIIEVPCRDERPAKQGRNPEVSSFSSCLPSPPLLLFSPPYEKWPSITPEAVSRRTGLW